MKAELLSADEKQVLATAYTRLRRLPTIQPLSLQMEIPETLTVRAGDEQGPVLKGTLTRHAGFEHRVQLALRGQPKEVKIPPITVEPEDTEFVLPVHLPPDAKTGEFKDVRLVASLVDVDDAIRDVRAQTKGFTLKVVSE